MPERADVLQIGLCLFVQRLWHCAKDIGGLVDPAPLLTRGREDIPQRRPEPERTVPSSQLRRHREAAFLQPLQQIPPAVRVLPEPVHDRQNVLLSIFVSTDNHQHTLAIPVQTRREVDPVYYPAGACKACCREGAQM